MGRKGIPSFGLLVRKLNCVRLVAFLMLTTVFVTAGNGCKSSMHSAITGDIPTDTLYLERIASLSDSIPGFVVGVSVVGESVILSLRRADYSFAIFPISFNSNPELVGRQGRGPGEVLDVCFNSIIEEQDGFSFVDTFGKRHARLVNGHYFISNPDNGFLNDPAKNSFIELSDSFLDINTDNETNEYVVYDKALSMKSYTGNFPKWSHSDDALPQFVYMKYLAKHPKKDRFVAVYGRYPVIRICNAEGKPLHEIYTYIDSFSGGMSNVFYSCVPVVNENYILAVSQGGTPMSEHPELHLLDWKGSVLKRFILNRPIDYFSASFHEGKLIAYSSSLESLYSAEIDINH